MVKMKKEIWSSKLSFILATSGAAIGLGNIQRFPYIVAQCGGAAFVIIYLICVLCMGIPLILVEFSIGRKSQQNPVKALPKLSGKGFWRWPGVLSVLTAYAILCYYLVPAGWTIGFSIQALTGSHLQLDEFTSHPWFSLGCCTLFQTVNVLVVSRGLKQGVEKVSKILLPLLFLLLIALVLYSLFLPNSIEGLHFYLRPDFSKVNAETILLALSQAFFSLCVGEAVLVTYGSYASKKDNLISSALSIAFFDSLVAVLAGLMIFPALASFGLHTQKDIGMIFNVMPEVFARLPMGHLFGFLFFLLLAFAALTTCIALFEIATNFLIETKAWSRKKSVLCVGLSSYFICIPIALSKGAHEGLSALKFSWLYNYGLYESLDFIWGSLAMVFNGFLLCFFVGWVWGSRESFAELCQGAPAVFSRQFFWWNLFVRYLGPLAIACILVSLFF